MRDFQWKVISETDEKQNCRMKKHEIIAREEEENSCEEEMRVVDEESDTDSTTAVDITESANSARNKMVDMCENISEKILQIPESDAPSKYDFETLFDSVCIPTLEEYLKLFESEDPIITADNNRIYPVLFE